MRSDRGSEIRSLAMTFGSAFLAAGIPWWLAPYDRFSFSTPEGILGFLVFAAIAAWAGGWSRLGFGRGSLVAGTGVPCAVMARVIVDGLRDPTSHNLWPFEILLAGVFGFGVAFAAGGFGRLLRRLLSGN